MRYPAILAGSLGLAALAALPAAAQQAPPPLAYVQPLPGPAVQTVQDRLRQAGAYTGRIDGIWGADSQAALERFQQTQPVAGDRPAQPGDGGDAGARSEHAGCRLGRRAGTASAAGGSPAAGLGARGAGAAADAGLLWRCGGRGVGRRDRGRDRALPARAGSAAGRAAWAGDGHGAGAGAGGAGVPVGASEATRPG